MKKYLLVMVCALMLFATGCGNSNKVVCTKTTTEGDSTLEEEIVGITKEDLMKFEEEAGYSCK